LEPSNTASLLVVFAMLYFLAPSTSPLPRRPGRKSCARRVR